MFATTHRKKMRSSEFELTKRMPKLAIHNANPPEGVGLDPKESHPTKQMVRTR
jgi:hypothetical protein